MLGLKGPVFIMLFLAALKYMKVFDSTNTGGDVLTFLGIRELIRLPSSDYLPIEIHRSPSIYITFHLHIPGVSR